MNVGERPVCVKYFHDRRLWVRVRTLLGFAKGRRGYFTGLRLQRMEVCVPEPLACLEFRPFGPTIVVMEVLKDILTVAGWFSDCQSQSGRIAVSRPLLAQFVAFASNLHRRGIYHLDFSPRNVMIQGIGDTPIFVLIDLEDVRFRASVSCHRCIQNLSRFYRESAPYLSVYTLIRFLRAYIKEMGWSCSAASLAKEILRTDF
jgi:RIO-like serine/threonine protein kinase